MHPLIRGILGAICWKPISCGKLIEVRTNQHCHRGAETLSSKRTRKEPFIGLSTCGDMSFGVIMHFLDDVDAASLRTGIPSFRPGDNVKVHVRVVEGTRSRIQIFQGVVIRRHGGGLRETFTVRKISFGTGVERTFPLHSPIVELIELVSRGDVRRAKLYYLRDLRGKKAKIKELRDNV